MKPYKMKVQNCALFSIVHIVCYIFPWNYNTRNSAPYTLQ